MGKLVVHGAVLQCSQGVATGALVVPPDVAADAGGPKLATVMHHKPTQNIPPFGMCQSLANPTVQSATAAANGVLTPMPCVPNTTSPWVPGSTGADIAGDALLTDDSVCSCAWAGQIRVVSSGTVAEVGR